MDKRNRNHSYRKSMTSVLGTKCKNCGSEEHVEYHHIVPLFLGGNDKLDNMIALCGRCHKAAHNGRHMSHYIDFSRSGRKRNANKQKAFDVIKMYLGGEIGTKKCKELLGYSGTCTLKNLAWFKEYAKENDIEEFKNTVDVAATTGNGGLYEGRIVGYIKYANGTINHISYHDTGMNNIEYVKRIQ